MIVRSAFRARFSDRECILLAIASFRRFVERRGAAERRGKRPSLARSFLRTTVNRRRIRVDAAVATAVAALPRPPQPPSAAFDCHKAPADVRSIVCGANDDDDREVLISLQPTPPAVVLVAALVDVALVEGSDECGADDGKFCAKTSEAARKFGATLLSGTLRVRLSDAYLSSARRIESNERRPAPPPPLSSLLASGSTTRGDRKTSGSACATRVVGAPVALTINELSIGVVGVFAGA